MRSLAALLTVVLLGASAAAAPVDPPLIQDLRYRLIGPFRASRTVGAVGVPSKPNVFYAGVNNGGVWKTDDYGRTWKPIFDDAPTGSIGDIAVSPSHPDVIYVGTGEGLHRPDLSVGDGIFKSTDGGDTWVQVGLRDVQQVGRIVVHPENPEVVFVAGMGHPYGPNEERGVFRTTNGGRTWDKVLYIDHDTGASVVELDPSDPRTLYAGLWEHREGPWENGSFSGPGTGLYSREDLQLQTDNSLACYRGYLEAQEIREAIDALSPERREAQMKFRGEGVPEDPDTLYGSIVETPPEDETVVGLQQKFLYVLKLLQQADVRPTSQAVDAVGKLQERLRFLARRWEEVQR